MGIKTGIGFYAPGTLCQVLRYLSDMIAQIRLSRNLETLRKGLGHVFDQVLVFCQALQKTVKTRETNTNVC